MEGKPGPMKRPAQGRDSFKCHRNELPNRKTRSYYLVRLLMTVAMFPAVTARVLPVVSTSSTVPMAALVDGDKTTSAERGQQDRNDK